MLTPNDALEIVFNNIGTMPLERVSVFEATDRFIADAPVSRRDLPPADNSAMDGYALIASDTETGNVKLKVKGVIAAGDNSCNLTVEKGTCYRIMTGACMPSGADSVIQHELTDNNVDVVTVYNPVKYGFCVRKKGEDMQAGTVINRIGDRVSPYHLGRFVSAGIFYLSVYRKPKVAIISTGNEITDPALQDDPSKIFDSNGIMMKTFLEEIGADVSYLGVVKDDKDALMQTFSQLKGFDIVVTSAGISVGDFDYMNLIAKELGIKWFFNEINQKPGMHMSYGLMGDTHIFACPGNPVSAMFCAYFYIKPGLLKLCGAKNYMNKPVQVKLGETVTKKKGRIQFDRVTIISENGELKAYPYKNQDSHRIQSLVEGNAYAMFDNNMIGEIKAGTNIFAYVFNKEGVLG